MLPYQEYEKKVFDFLMSKHQSDPSFTFSLRQRITKGAENDIFIGTVKQKYFGTTFWSIPLGFPGSTSDLIDVFFTYSKNGNLQYKFEINHTRNPPDLQNKLGLQLAKKIKKRFKIDEAKYEENSEANKNEWAQVKSPQLDYDNFEALKIDLNNDIERLIPIIDKEILYFKSENPEFVAHRITETEFNEFQNKLKKRLDNPFVNTEVPTVEPEKEHTDPLNHPLNTIFYGPPGTGKTYTTLIRAAEIITDIKVANYEDAKRIFNERLGNQIEFITFHQNYSYEDFIQGLRPDTESDGDLKFYKRDGIFKKIADRALKNLIESKENSLVQKEFELVFKEFISPMVEGEVPELEVKMKKVSFFINDITNKSIHFRKNDGESKHTLSIGTLKTMYESKGENIVLGGLMPYYTPILNLLLEKGKGKGDKVDRKNYVIIIDEINRANISRVFGELITLIEIDKRSEGKIPLQVKLPSDDTFMVPSNLYIIGTMNTADKSIALLDIALRRRFEFEAMYPKYEIDEVEIPDKEVLLLINNQIIKEKGHDFQIGHAYFMEKGSLVEKMNKKVIPLLLEYFMNNEEEVTKILNNSKFNILKNSWPIQVY